VIFVLTSCLLVILFCCVHTINEVMNEQTLTNVNLSQNVHMS